MRNAITGSWIAASLLVAVCARDSSATVVRTANENPVVEIARSTFYGGLAGLSVGLAYASLDHNAGGGATSSGYAIGTLVGLGVGIYYVSTRGESRAMYEVGGPHPGWSMPVPEPAPDGGRVRLVGVTF
jgi:hypothetical protein